MITGNHFLRNGFDSSSQYPFTDGVTARAFNFTATGFTEYREALAGFTLSRNRADFNMGLGFNVVGVTDGGGNRAKFNGDPTECIGLDCRIPGGVAHAEAVAGTDLLPELRHSQP